MFEDYALALSLLLKVSEVTSTQFLISSITSSEVLILKASMIASGFTEVKVELISTLVFKVSI